MTYIPAGETTGVIETLVLQGSGTTSGTTPLTIMSFNLVRYQDIAVRFLVMMDRPTTTGASGTGDARLSVSAPHLECASWTYGAYHRMFAIESGVYAYGTSAINWNEFYSAAQQNILLNSVPNPTNGAALLYEKVRFQYDPNPYAGTTPCAVILQGTTTTQAAFHAHVIAIRYRKAS